MDLFSHAVAGAAVGAAYGRPLLGAFFGVLPDLVLPLKRIHVPVLRYSATHSLAFVLVAGMVGAAIFERSVVPLLALLSHILLDIPTHGPKWAPPLFYPFSAKRYSLGPDWEFFSPSWWKGLLLTLIWSAVWLSV
jgi:membrane-bound metal-dependent hydrolase YbcI (DUF457 family)